MKQKGFTLIELLVVISIIGVLATLLIANFNSARERARDAQRKADLRNIQTALRLYYNDFNKYPKSDSNFDILGCGSSGTTVCVWGETWTGKSNATYISKIPKDPLNKVVNVNDYKYVQTDTANEIYTLSACLENKSDEALPSPLPAVDAWCTTGAVYSVQP